MASSTGRKRVTFQIKAEPGSEVQIAGSFNDWDPSKKTLTEKDSGVYVGTLMLPKGTHQYKFIINGTWCADPECQEWTPNDQGTINSILKLA